MPPRRKKGGKLNVTKYPHSISLAANLRNGVTRNAVLLRYMVSRLLPQERQSGDVRLCVL